MNDPIDGPYAMPEALLSERPGWPFAGPHPYTPPVPVGAAPSPADGAHLAGPPSATVISILAFRVAPAGTTREEFTKALLMLAAVRDCFMPHTWVKGVLAAGPGWFECAPRDPKALAWSLSGAMMAATDCVGRSPEPKSPEAIAWAVLGMSIRKRHRAVTISYYNDFIATHVGEVVAEIDAAIKELRSIMRQRRLMHRRGA